MQKAVGQQESLTAALFAHLCPGLKAAQPLSSLLCRAQHFLSTSRAPYPQERFVWDHGAGRCQVWSTHMAVRWLCFPTLGIFPAPESWKRCSSHFGMQHLQVWGSLTLTTLSLLSHTPYPKSLPACK